MKSFCLLIRTYNLQSICYGNDIDRFFKYRRCNIFCYLLCGKAGVDVRLAEVDDASAGFTTTEDLKVGNKKIH